MPQLRFLILVICWFTACNSNQVRIDKKEWTVSILPSSVRLDPSSNQIIDNRFNTGGEETIKESDLLKENWIYNGREAQLFAARGEYVSFQVVLTNLSDVALKNIQLKIAPFNGAQVQFRNEPEVFLEWSVEVKTTSTGYPTATLGKGWYPDALIPYHYIQADSSQVSYRWTYPLELPDFNNRVDKQTSAIFWIDQYIPFKRELAPPGAYQTHVTIETGDQVKSIPIVINVWDFALPNANKFKASLQHEGFLSGKDDQEELELYQLFKRNRISLMDPTYRPGLEKNSSGTFQLDWQAFDERLVKYFDGTAFTKAYGYNFGPGYGEPIETFILPFNVRGKHGNRGWPDVGNPEEEQTPKNRARYINTIEEIRRHMQLYLEPEKTELTVYLNGLDESYFPEAWDRMVYYGDLFKEHYPEIQFRIDGAYGEEAMSVVKNSIDSWASHTINYNISTVRKYQDMGIRDWLYGPLLYESKVNSWVGSSTFIDLPLVNERAISWSCWKYRTYSWISWGIGAGWERAWFDPETWKDTYKEGADSDPDYFFKKLNGNGLLVYSPGIIPNVTGPCPSIRLKNMRNGIQEYEYLRMLSDLDGSTQRADSICNLLVDSPYGADAIGNLKVWSFDAEQWDRSRIEIGHLIGTYSNK